MVTDRGKSESCYTMQWNVDCSHLVGENIHRSCLEVLHLDNGYWRKLESCPRYDAASCAFPAIDDCEQSISIWEILRKNIPSSYLTDQSDVKSQ